MANIINGSTGNDPLVGTVGVDDTINALAGDDVITIEANGLFDLVDGGIGYDSININWNYSGVDHRLMYGFMKSDGTMMYFNNFQP